MSHESPHPAIDARLLDEDAEDLYEHAPCGYLSIAPDGTIVKVNDTFLGWTGYTRGALQERRFQSLLTIGGQIFFETHFAPLLRMQGFVREIALDVVCADSRRMSVLVNAAEKTDAAGAPAVVRVTVFDVTERRRYERELLRAVQRAEQAAEAKTSAVATISHDIRAPLGAIFTAVALLEKTGPTDAQLRYIRILRSSCDQALGLVNSVLALGRLEAGQTTLHERVFDLPRLVATVTGAIALAIDQKPDLELRVSVDPAIPARLIGDPDKLGQVLTNLLTNAVKFTERGFVSLVVGLRDLSAQAATIEVLVSDTGIGIPSDRLARIFEEYTQASTDIEQRYGGSGLGLAISRKVLLLFRSELHVTSTVGQGTTFSFVLQLPRPGDEAGAAEPA